jgi:lysozyme family protein
MTSDYKKDAAFCEIIKHVINSEGKFVNNPHDKGGPTMYGVAWNFNADYLKIHLGMKKPMDIRNLTLDQANQLYYEKYWLASHGNGLTDIDLAYIHLDAAINCGVGAASAFLDHLSMNPKNFDGSGGKNRTLFMTLFLEYTARRLKYYTHCKDRDVFLDGWINRMADVITNSLGME